MTFLYIFVCFFALGGTIYANGRKSFINRYEELEEFDPVAVTRCDVICQSFAAIEKEQVILRYFPLFVENDNGTRLYLNGVTSTGSNLG